MNFGPGLLGPAAMSIEAERVPVSYPEGFRGRATGAILVDGDVGRYRVSGLVDLTQAYYTAELDARARVARPARLPARRPAGAGVDPGQPPPRGRRAARGAAAHPQQPGPDRRHGHGDRERDARPARGHRPAQPDRGRAGRPPPRAHPRAGGARRAQRLPGRGARRGLRGPDPGGRGDHEPAGAGVDGRPAARHPLPQPAGPLADRPRLAPPHRPDLDGGGVRGGRVRGRGARRRPRRRAAEERRRDAPHRRVERRVDAARRGGPHPALQHRHAGRPEPRRSSTRPASTAPSSAGSRSGTPAAAGSASARSRTPRRGRSWRPPTGSPSTSSPAAAKAERPQASLARLDSLRFEGALPLPEEELRPRHGAPGRAPLRHAAPRRGRRPRAGEAGRGRVPQRVGRRGRAARPSAGGATSTSCSGWRRGRGSSSPGRETTPARRRAGAAAGAWPPYASPEAAAAALARAARVELQAAGHYEARVGHELRGSGAEVEVVLEVVRGPLGRGVDVVFDGNERLTAEELLGTMPKPGSREFFEALDRPARLVAGARVAYAGLGHVRARVGPPRSRFDAPSGRLEVTLPVREGRVRARRRAGPARRGAPARGGRAGAVAARGRAVRRRGLRRRPGRASPRGYGGEGWMEARVRGVLEVASGDVRVTLDADLGPRPRLGEIRVVSSGRTQRGDGPPRDPGPGPGRRSSRGISRRAGPASRTSARSRRSTCGWCPSRGRPTCATSR